MIKSEILEFLELSESAADDDIRRRAQEKQTFFLRLQQTAPNQVLKNIHTRNLEKIQQILQLVGGNIQDENIAVATPSPIQTVSPPKESPLPNSKPIGWLIRHTENMETKSFPFFTGKNIIGREPVPGCHSILLNEDPYVSRQHAVLEVNVLTSVSVRITDGWQKPSKNGVYLNSNPARLQTATVLKNNDTIQIGNTKLTLRLADDQHSLSRIEKEVSASDYKQTVIINLL
jgi:hypothetical protein